MTSNPIDPAVFDRMEARGNTGDGELGPEGVGPGPDGLLGPEGCYPPCQHLRLKPNLSATTSVMAITTNLWGVTCEDCGEKWDIGQVLQAIPDLAAAQARIGVLATALTEIAKARGPFSRDPLTHASNTISHMQDVAVKAIGEPQP